jgi:hypothetical protein
MVVGRFGADGTRVCVTTLTAQELKHAADLVLTLLLRVVAGNCPLTKPLLTKPLLRKQLFSNGVDEFNTDIRRNLFCFNRQIKQKH